MTQRRNGFTLIDILLVVALLTTLLGGAVGLVSVARLSDQLAAENQLRRREIRRFADDLRRDTRVADECELVDRSFTLTSSHSVRRQVTYQIESDSKISRSVTNSRQAQTASDFYDFSSGASITVDDMVDPKAVRYAISFSERPDQSVEIIAAWETYQ